MLEVGEGLQPAVLLKRDLVALERLGVGQWRVPRGRGMG